MSLQNSRQISDVKVMLKMGSDGAGIINIEKTGTSGLVDTYTITLSNGHKYTFDVTNGKGIKSITKTGTSGLVDTYTITFDDDTTTTYTVTNGNGIVSIAKTSTSGNVDTYTITFTDGTTTTYEVTNGEGSSAASLPYDNTQSGLQATNVQDAIDEIVPTINSTGTASSSGTRYQRIGIGGVYTEIDGTKYMEQTITLSTSASTNCTFTHADITVNSVIEPYCEEWGLAPETITTTAGQCLLTFPKADSARQVKVRIYIR